MVSYVTEDMARRNEWMHRGLRRCVIHNGIEPLDRSAYGRPTELEPGSIHIGIVGRMTEVKGISFALRALASPDVPSSACLNIIGAGPQEEELRREAATLGLRTRARFLGFRSDARSFMAHLDLLLMPSLHEGLPYSLLEAMSLATPIVASRIGGLAEVIRDGDTGLLVPVRNVSALVAAIVCLVSDPSFARSIGAAAAAVQRKDYTLAAMGGKYWDLYEDCAATVRMTRCDRGRTAGEE